MHTHVGLLKVSLFSFPSFFSSVMFVHFSTQFHCIAYYERQLVCPRVRVFTLVDREGMRLKKGDLLGKLVLFPVR